MDNMNIYSKVRSVPKCALKEIKAGRLKGMSDINPMWRIEKLTEVFGPCGFGWWYEITEKHLEHDPITKQTAAFVDIKLYVVDPESGKESRAIPGTGGASFVSQESKGAYMSDEGFKMALTDAISVAAKALGVGADVYFAKSESKYGAATEPAKPMSIVCEECGSLIDDFVNTDGSKTTAFKAAQITKKRTGKCLCQKCWDKAKNESADS